MTEADATEAAMPVPLVTPGDLTHLDAKVCGHRHRGDTGISWVCIKTPHDLPEEDRPRHHFISVAEASIRGYTL